MTRIHHLSVALTSVCALIYPGIATADESALTGMEIVERSIDAVGGAEAIASVESFHVTGSYSIPALGAEGTIELYYQAPDKAIFTVSFPSFGELRRGFDGTTAWAIDPNQGSRVLEGAERDAFVKQVSRGLGLLPTASMIKSATLIETGEFDEQECHTVEVTSTTGQTWTEIYSAETGLLVARKEMSPSPQGELNVIYRPSGYLDVDPIRVPVKWDNDAGVQQWTATYNEVNFDDVDGSVFALPEEIQALLD